MFEAVEAPNFLFIERERLKEQKQRQVVQYLGNKMSSTHPSKRLKPHKESMYATALVMPIKPSL